MNDDLCNKLGGPMCSGYNGRRSLRNKFLPRYLDHLRPEVRKDAGEAVNIKPAKARVVESENSQS